MLKEEFENMIGKKISAKEYSAIETVYNFHPAIPNVDGKEVIAQIYKIGGNRIIADMIPTAKKIFEIDSNIMALEQKIADFKAKKLEIELGE